MRWHAFTVIAATLLIQQASGNAFDKGFNVVKTTTLPNGQVIDWIEKESQGNVASPPPFAPEQDASENTALAAPFEGESVGPEGTVPILRSDGKHRPTKSGPPMDKKSRIMPRQNQYQHWHTSTAEEATSYGTSASLSMFEAYVEYSGDFSLLQGALIRKVTNYGYQTLEAGWINYPDQVQRPHLFTFFNTGNYGFGDYIGGWNTDYKGWVQTDNTYYPGMELNPLSVRGGEQHDFQIQYKLHEKNWWFAVNGTWIGYYPGSLFTKDGRSASETLESRADQVNWYGEIYQTGDPETTSDMGSGHFADEGYGKAAYIRNMKIFDTKDSNNTRDYDGSWQVVVEDPKRYSLDTHFKSGEEWGSYFYIGGPGAGGVVGG
jgi:hypothetical protein